MKIGLVGPSYQQRSLPFDAQRLVNMYPILDDAGKEVASLFGTPGLSLFCDLVTTSGRKCFCAANGRAFVVSGNTLFEIESTGAFSNRGTLNTTTGNVTMAENGVQLAVCDGADLYILTYATNVFAQVTSAGLPSDVGQVTTIDGYFVVNELNTGRFYISALLDGTTWDALDFATAEANPDNLLAVANSQGQLYLIGTRTFEVWTNTGSTTFPFQRISGAIGEIGIMAPDTIVDLDNTLIWVGRDKNGKGVVYRTNGFRPQRISTEPIEILLQGASDPLEMSAFSYQQDGHLFYIITGGGLSTSICYDVTTGLWHERAYLNAGALEPHLAKDVMFAFDKHLVCDRQSGKVYELSPTVYSDNGDEISRERIFTHISDENKEIRYNRLELGVETGVGLQTGQGSDPLISLRLSKDGARTWSDWYEADIGAAGQYQTRVVFRRLGIADQMTFHIRITDPVKVAITGAYLS